MVVARKIQHYLVQKKEIARSLAEHAQKQI